MNLPKYQRFTPPARLTSKEQVDFCSRVIDQYRSEIPQLRSSTNILKRQKDQAEDEVTYWKEKYNQEKKEKEKLKKENEQLKTEIEKLTKRTKRNQVALFDHGNFKSPMREGRKVDNRDIPIQTENEMKTHNNTQERESFQRRVFIVEQD